MLATLPSAGNVIGLAGVTMKRWPTVTASATCLRHAVASNGCGIA